ncbi:MAG: hypothetical protein ACLP8X_35685, partial [Streptosporangiaceae bacterium]
GLVIGTAVNGITALAVLVTIPVAFGIFFAGVAGPNAASAWTASRGPGRGTTRTVPPGGRPGRGRPRCARCARSW